MRQDQGHVGFVLIAKVFDGARDEWSILDG